MMKGDVRDRPGDTPVQVGASECCPQEKIPSVFQYSVYFEKIQMFGDKLAISM